MGPIGIKLLSAVDKFSLPLFCGWQKVQFKENQVLEGYFHTVLSTSVSQRVAEMFIPQKRGVLLKLDKSISENAKCAHVEWISSRGNETEIMVARGHHFKWRARVLEDSLGGIQIVQLSANTGS